MTPSNVGLFYRDNVAIVNIAIQAWSTKPDDLSSIIQQTTEATYIVRNSANELVFERTYLDVQQQVLLAFALADTYTVIVSLKNCYGAMQVFTTKLTIVDLQANYVLAVADNKRHPTAKTYDNMSLAQIAAELQKPSTVIDISGMINATLYYSTKTAYNLAVPDFSSFPDINTFNPEQPIDTDVIHKWLKNLDNAESNIQYLSKLNDIRLIDCNCMTLRQYGAPYANIQFDIDETGVFECSIAEFVTEQGTLASPDMLSIDYATPYELLSKINTYCLVNKNSYFAKFTYSIQHVQQEDGSLTWCLYAYSIEQLSSAAIHIQTPCKYDVETVELTAHWPATFIVDVLDTNAHDVTINDDTVNCTIEQLLSLLSSKGFVYMQLHTPDDSLRYLIESPYASCLLSSDMFACNVNYATLRKPYDTVFAKIDNGSTVTVGSQICCFPDEHTYAYAPHDIEWNCYYVSNGVVTVEQTSNKYLFRHVFKHIGDYDIELSIINPRTKQVVKRINKSVNVTRG